MLKPNRLEQTKFAAQQLNCETDPYLAALEFLSFFHGKPFSEAEILRRLPLVDGKLDALSFCRAAEKSGLVAKVVERDAAGVSALVCPFVVLLKNGDVAIATEKGSRGITRLIIPGTPNVLEVAKGTLAQQAEDVVIYVADSASGKELEGGQQLKQGHWLWSVVYKYWATWIYVIAAALFINLLGLAVPLFVMNVYDRVIPNNSISTLWALAVGVVIALVFDFILRMLRAIVVDYSGRRIDMRISSDLFDQAMDASMAARPASAGEIASHIREFEAVRDFFTSASISSLIDLLFIGIFLGVLWLLVGPLALVALLAIPVVLIATLLIQIPLGRAVSKSQETISNRQSVLVETLVAIETIKAMSAEGVMQRKWEQAISGSVRAGSSIRFWSSLAMFFTMFTQQCVTVLILVWGAYLVADGEISIGALVASNILAGRVLAPLSNIAMTLARTQQSLTALRQLNNLMALERDHGYVKDNAGKVTSGAIGFAKVTFSYPREERSAIDDLSISIAAGERVGIIGRVGSGKSTFGKLLSGLYLPDGGNVLIDGTDTRHYNRSDLRSAVLFCGQDADLFAGTIRDNILVGNSTDDEHFERCAIAAGVSAFAQTHPLGYAMQVGERGQGLSGGQRQAVALARALITKPKILFLDEPTGAMDNQSEALFIRGLQGWMTDQTTLIISTHRNSLLELVTRLVVLENGKLAADGPKQRVLEALKKKSAKSVVVKTGDGDG